MGNIYSYSFINQIGIEFEISMCDMVSHTNDSMPWNICEIFL